MRVSEIHKTGRLAVSFELFPPRDAEAEAHLFDESLPQLLDLRPDFVTCTYGAGGSTREKTLEIVSRIKQTTTTEVASHLTCVGSSRTEIRDYLDRARAAGITNIVALRGDPPRGDETFRPHPDGFTYASELVTFIRELGGFDVAVAGYPEGHPECPDKHLDWQHHAEKINAGADLVITQLFYDTRAFFEFEDYLRSRLGLTVPIVPGILPILSGPQIKRFCGMCGAKLPPDLVRHLDSFGDDKTASRDFGIELATSMCQELMAHGVPGFHFYTLNRVHSTREVLRNLGLAGR